MNKTIARDKSEVLLKRLETNPVTALLGPRQCGKTTVARQVARTYNKTLYLDLENPESLNKLTDPIAFLTENRDKLIIIDEIQMYPDLFAPVVYRLF